MIFCSVADFSKFIFSTIPISIPKQSNLPSPWYSLQCALPTKRTETLRSTAPLFTVFSFLGVNIPGLVAAVKMPLSALLLPSPFPMAPFSPPPPTKMTVVLSHGFLLRSKCFDASLVRSLARSFVDGDGDTVSTQRRGESR